MIARKAAVVEQTTKGIDFLMDKNKVTVFNGLGSFKDAATIHVEGEKPEDITAKNIIIATGSKPASLPFINIDKERIITYRGIELKEIPKHMIVIGGGSLVWSWVRFIKDLGQRSLLLSMQTASLRSWTVLCLVN